MFSRCYLCGLVLHPQAPTWLSAWSTSPTRFHSRDHGPWSGDFVPWAKAGSTRPCMACILDYGSWTQSSFFRNFQGCPVSPYMACKTLCCPCGPSWRVPGAWKLNFSLGNFLLNSIYDFSTWVVGCYIYLAPKGRPRLVARQEPLSQAIICVNSRKNLALQHVNMEPWNNFKEHNSHV